MTGSHWRLPKWNSQIVLAHPLKKLKFIILFHISLFLKLIRDILLLNSDRNFQLLHFFTATKIASVLTFFICSQKARNISVCVFYQMCRITSIFSILSFQNNHGLSGKTCFPPRSTSIFYDVVIRFNSEIRASKNSFRCIFS